MEKAVRNAKRQVADELSLSRHGDGGRFAGACPICYKHGMDHEASTIRKYTDFDEMKADEYRYWQSRPAHERIDAVDEMIEVAYALKGWKIEPDVPRLQRPFVRLPVPWR